MRREVNEYALRWKLKFNNKKSKVMVVGMSGNGMR